MGNPIIANDPNKLVWLKLKQLTSIEVCKNLLRDKSKRNDLCLDESVLNKKAIGLASAIESALGYWQEKPVSLNSWVLSRYYALLQLTIAEQVADVKSNEDLASIQKYTEQGHGLSIWSKGFANPLDYKIYSLKGGHFYSYAKYLGLNPKKWSADRRAKEVDEIDLANSVSIKELFQHIPELEPVLFSFIQTQSNCLHIGHSEKNYEYESMLRKQELEKGNFNFRLPKRNFTYVNIYENLDNPIDLDFIKNTGIPLIDIGEGKAEDSGRMIFTGKLNHREEELWWSAIEYYKSNFTGSLYIAPLFNQVNDIIVRHFFLLYGLSILVRYTPDVWHDIKTGCYDNIGALIEYYLTTFEEVIPLLMLDRISGKKHRTAQPGAMNSLI